MATNRCREKTSTVKFTLGENIADLSGLAISYKAMAYEKLPEDKIADWSPEQLCSSLVGVVRGSESIAKRKCFKRLLTDPHSPSQFRANGPVMNIDAFYDAFEVKEGDQLYKPEG